MSDLLSTLDCPGDLKKLQADQLPLLAREIRELIIRTVSRTGGHLAANLGAVEMTIALLRVFDPPADKLIWDVSHQAYTYKILTGRRKAFSSLRQTDGLSGFLRRAESPYDAFGAGHAGTAVSAALGMAIARDRKDGSGHVVAIVGDAAIGCGSSFEALNNVASSTRRLILVLNDNKMSISANVGSFSRYLGRLLAHPRYNRWKSRVESFARTKLGLGWVRSFYFRLEEAVKAFFLRSGFFEELGFRYIGPIDGHDLGHLIAAFETARNSDEPVVLHVSTQKGRGYPFAEDEPEAWHGTGAFETETGRLLSAGSTPRYSQIFGTTLERLAQDDDRIVAITAAMASGTGLSGFAKKHPDRFFDVGISEEHAVIFAAGLACEGFTPVVAMYSTFLQRAVDYVIHDVCLQDLPVIFCLDRAGLVGDDGPTHHGFYDIPILRSFPNLAIMQPSDEAELANLLYSAIRRQKPAVLRYPRGAGPGTLIPGEFTMIPFGKAEVLLPGSIVQVWALGDQVPLGRAVCGRLRDAGIDAGLVNPRFVKPLDIVLLREQAARASLFITIENGAVTGGFGSIVGDELSLAGYCGRRLAFGWPDAFVPQGSLQDSYERYGFTESAIIAAVYTAMPELKR